MKRGVSAVVATVSIIMITVAAVGIIWAAIIPMVRDRLGSSDACNYVDVSIETSQGYTCLALDKNLTLVQVRKGLAEVNISKLKFLLSSNGNSISFMNDTSLSRGSSVVYYLNTAGIDNVDKIEVVPIVKDGNSERNCKAVSDSVVLSCGFSAFSQNDIQTILNEGNVWNSDRNSGGGGSGQDIFTGSHIFIGSPFHDFVYDAGSEVWFNVSTDLSEVNWSLSLDNGVNISFVPNVTLYIYGPGVHNVSFYLNSSTYSEQKNVSFNVSSAGVVPIVQCNYEYLPLTQCTVGADCPDDFIIPSLQYPDTCTIMTNYTCGVCHHCVYSPIVTCSMS